MFNQGINLVLANNLEVHQITKKEVNGFLFRLVDNKPVSVLGTGRIFRLNDRVKPSKYAPQINGISGHGVVVGLNIPGDTVRNAISTVVSVRFSQNPVPVPMKVSEITLVRRTR